MDRSDIEKKWIIEIPKTANKIIVVGVYGDKEVYAYSVDVHDLDSYAEPDMEKIRKEAYRQGYDTGYGTKVNEFYEQGLADAWEAARKIADIWESGENDKWIIVDDSLPITFASYSASETIERIRQHEQKQKEQEQEAIQVGDEVEAVFGKATITYITETHVYYFYPDGSHGCDKKEYVTKTGRHFPEIAAVLAKMKEEL